MCGFSELRQGTTIGLPNLRNLVILCFGTKWVWGGGVYPRILGWNVVLQGFLGWKTKIRENNSKPKEKNVRKDCAPKAPENFGFRQDFWIGIIN